MFIKKVEIIEESGTSTVRINDEEVQGLTSFEFKKSSTGRAELTLNLDVVSETEKI